MTVVKTNPIISSAKTRYRLIIFFSFFCAFFFFSSYHHYHMPYLAPVLLLRFAKYLVHCLSNLYLVSMTLGSGPIFHLYRCVYLVKKTTFFTVPHTHYFLLLLPFIIAIFLRLKFLSTFFG